MASEIRSLPRILISHSRAMRSLPMPVTVTHTALFRKRGSAIVRSRVVRCLVLQTEALQCAEMQTRGVRSRASKFALRCLSMAARSMAWAVIRGSTHGALSGAPQWGMVMPCDALRGQDRKSKHAAHPRVRGSLSVITMQVSACFIPSVQCRHTASACGCRSLQCLAVPSTADPFRARRSDAKTSG